MMFSVGSMASAMAGMTGFGWVADAVGPAESLIGLGLVLLLTAAVACQPTAKTFAQRVASVLKLQSERIPEGTPALST